ncbi:MULTISPECIES: DUF5999 family protein [unclassified Frankia]|uniref:DUF5999 family protein n=2 Tax=Frankia TaxID=1854 RepID=UPI002119B420|nr:MULTISPECIES: DUF5999 family protein [unclassified Frankia]
MPTPNAPTDDPTDPAASAAPRAFPPPRRGCPHSPPCPAADGADRDAARVTSQHWDQGWSLLCNGVILFDDTGEILPTGRTVEPRRALPRAACAPRPPAPRRASQAPVRV